MDIWEIQKEMSKIVPTWFTLSDSARYTISKDILARYTHNNQYWTNLRTFVYNYALVIEKDNTDNPREIWKNWARLLKSINTGE